MAKQTINQGTAPTGAGGDTFRSGSAKLQANDDELYAAFGASGGVLPVALPIVKGGTGATTAAAARTAFGLGTAATSTVTTSASDSTVGRVLKVGDFGLGSSPLNFNSEIRSGILSIHPSDAENIPEGVGVTIQGLHIKSPDGYGLDIMASRGGKSRLFSRTYDPKGGVGWVEYYSTGNTTKDSNGFLKGASPIVQLFSNEIKLNDEATQQPITFEKLGIGNYLIKGSSGFAQEGWYIETPKDANGNVLFSVIYETLENGDISVKTYKKKFDLETASIVADLDNPVDITENRWIDLRLQELPQPEIEIPEPIAPPDFQPTGLAQAVATVMESYHDPE